MEILKITIYFFKLKYEGATRIGCQDWQRRRNLKWPVEAGLGGLNVAGRSEGKEISVPINHRDKRVGELI